MKARTRQKHVTAFRIFKGLVSNKTIEEIDHFEMNLFFNDVAKLPPKRTGKFKDMTYKQMIAANDGDGLHKDSFGGHKSCINKFIDDYKENCRHARF